MALWILELNDTAIRVARDAQVVLQSPGYAVLTKHDVDVGQAAFAKSRLHPLQTFNRFWHQLGEAPLSNPSPTVRHYADLAYAHLSEIHRQVGAPGEMLFVVPGSLSEPQLSLLLGIADACGFKAIGLMDAAIASASRADLRGDCVHVDIHQHQSVLTWLHVDEHLTRKDVASVEDAGLNQIHDAMVALIADAFIKQSRFDPLHHAETEQAVYNDLGGWLETLSGAPEVLVAIDYQGRRQEARLRRDEVVAVVHDVLGGLLSRVQDAPLCLLSDRLARLPGVRDRLVGAQSLPADAVFEACRAHRLKFRPADNGGVRLVTRLPVGSAREAAESGPDTAVTVRREPSRVGATHILVGGQAFPITDEPLHLLPDGQVTRSAAGASLASIAVDDGRSLLHAANGNAVLVNGKPVSHAMLILAGDKIELAGNGATFISIEMVDQDGAPSA